MEKCNSLLDDYVVQRVASTVGWLLAQMPAVPAAQGTQPLPISLSDELFIYHSDIRKDSFLYDAATDRTWIIDFRHIGT
jgi:hypothetical protein